MEGPGVLAGFATSRMSARPEAPACRAARLPSRRTPWRLVLAWGLLLLGSSSAFADSAGFGSPGGPAPANLVLGIAQVPSLVVTVPAIGYIWWTGTYGNVQAIAYTVLLLDQAAVR